MTRIVYPPVTAGLRFALAILLSAGAAAWAQEPAEPPDEEYAAIQPLADEALLLDATNAGDRAVAVGDHGIILVIDEDGSWKQATVPTRSMLTGVWFHDENLGWAVGHDAAILKTTDGGANWRRVHFAPDLLLPFFDVWFADENNGIAVGAYGFVMRTEDGGETWEESSLDAEELAAEAEEEARSGEDEAGEDEPFWEEDFAGGGDFHLNKIASADDGTLFIAGEAGNFYRSTDGGESWVILESPYGGSFFSALPLEGGDVMAFGLRGNIYRSDDSGISWSPVEAPVDITLNEGVELADGTIVLVGMSGTILVSHDGGESFELVQRPDRKALTKVLARADGGVLVFGEGGIVRLDSGEF